MSSPAWIWDACLATVVALLMTFVVVPAIVGELQARRTRPVMRR